jgi:penicillin-binding protein 1A
MDERGPKKWTMTGEKTRTKSQIIKKRGHRSKQNILFRLLKWGILLSLLAMAAIAVVLVGGYYYLSEDLPKITSLADYRPPVITTMYSDDGRKIGEFFKERRIVVPLTEMPDMLKKAFVAAEDARFYQHKGIDFYSILRAFIKNLKAGTIVQGGSTITQQVTKSFFLTPERSYSRKLKEAILAYRIEKFLTKDEILFLYLNQIYLGHGAYGVGAAADNYFNKTVQEMTLAECAVLAGLPQAPTRYSPFHALGKANQRRIYVVNRMRAEGYITNLQASEAIEQKLDIRARRNLYLEEVPSYTEHVRRYVETNHGTDALYREGLKIFTSVNIEMQRIARQEIDKGLRDLDKRRGYRGPLSHLAKEQIEKFNQTQAAEIEEIGGLAAGMRVKGVVIAVNDNKKVATVQIGNNKGRLQLETMKWARQPDPEVAYFKASISRISQAIKVGDVISVKIEKKLKKGDPWEMLLDQEPQAQAALICLETETGQVKAMVGGRSFKDSQFNRAIQSRRQPGSAFKPIIYAAALDKGYTPATALIDSPVVFRETNMDFTWKPKNYENTFHGRTLFREALAKSMNVITVKILKDIGVDYAIDYARNMGITSHLSRDLSIALGSSGVSLLELTGAYSVFANRGYQVAPVFITKIVDRDGNVIEEMALTRKKVISESTAYIMTNLLEGVVKNGTGWRVKALKRPVAGKTGTTNDLYDAWFLGYTPRFVTGTWVGFDEEASLGKGETGSRTASPIWLGFMQQVLEGKPIRVFQVPDEVMFAKIDAKTGLLSIPESEKTIFECFKEGTAPTEYTKKPGTISGSGEFFKLDM